MAGRSDNYNSVSDKGNEKVVAHKGPPPPGPRRGCGGGVVGEGLVGRLEDNKNYTSCNY